LCLFWRISTHYRSCIFYPCYLLPHFPLLHFQRPPFNICSCFHTRDRWSGLNFDFCLVTNLPLWTFLPVHLYGDGFFPPAISTHAFTVRLPGYHCCSTRNYLKCVSGVKLYSLTSETRIFNSPVCWNTTLSCFPSLVACLRACTALKAAVKQRCAIESCKQISWCVTNNVILRSRNSWPKWINVESIYVSTVTKMEFC